MLGIAGCLSDKHKTDVLWGDSGIKQKALDKLNIDLKSVGIVPNFLSTKVNIFERLIESHKYDLLIILSDGSIPMSFSKKTYLHFQHPVEWVEPDMKTKLKLARIDKIICNSYFTKYFIDRKFGVESTVLYPPCISLEEIKMNSLSAVKSKKNIILTVGRLSPDSKYTDIKKIKVLIETFKSMVDEGLGNWEMRAAVSFLDENTALADEIEELTVNYPVKIIRNCEYEELKKLYKSAKIYWHAAGYGVDLSRYPEKAEHFGITIVEAISWGVLPLVFSGGGLPEIVDDRITGYLWDDIEELKKNTKKIMLDDALRIEMNKLGAKKVENFTYENFCKRLSQLI